MVLEERRYDTLEDFGSQVDGPMGLLPPVQANSSAEGSFSSKPTTLSSGGGGGGFDDAGTASGEYTFDRKGCYEHACDAGKVMCQM